MLWLVSAKRHKDFVTAMVYSCIDHLVVTAPTLEIGAEYIKDNLGVEMEPGGKHPYMGTWNLLLSLGGSTYLEVISINPTLPKPDHPRWFGLDNRYDNFLPTLSNWVARTTDIHSTVSGCSETVGDIVPMARGDLNWHITIPSDGISPIEGAAPALIEWPAGIHPTDRLEDKGLRLQKLEIRHPQPERVQRLLSSMNFKGEVVVTPATDMSCSLLATFHTPQGVCCLTPQVVEGRK